VKTKETHGGDHAWQLKGKDKKKRPVMKEVNRTLVKGEGQKTTRGTKVEEKGGRYVEAIRPLTFQKV